MKIFLTILILSISLFSSSIDSDKQIEPINIIDIKHSGYNIERIYIVCIDGYKWLFRENRTTPPVQMYKKRSAIAEVGQPVSCKESAIAK